MNEISSAECVACRSRSSLAHVVPEAMFGTGESFTYHECVDCGTLRIARVPDDLARYYDRGSYYSFNNVATLQKRPWLRSPIVGRLLRLNTTVYLRFGVGRGLPWTRLAGIHVGSRILDLGCGDGRDLQRLQLLGFHSLQGADPFLEGDTWVAPGVRVTAQGHDDVTGTFDCILMNHSLEHVDDPRSLLSSVRRLVREGGCLVVRMPVRDCLAWDTYGVHWVQLDAPRHLVVYTRDGFRRILESVGFRLERLIDDSWSFQFWGSELVRAGVPHGRGPGSFSRSQLARWARAAAKANRAGQGDSILAVCRVSEPHGVNGT